MRKLTLILCFGLLISFPRRAIATAPQQCLPRTEVKSIGYVINGKAIQVIHNNGIGRRWNIGSYQLEQTTSYSTYSGTDWRFLPNGKTLISFSENESTVRFWDIATGKLLDDWNIVPWNTDRGQPIAYALNEKTILVGYSNQAIQAWDIASKRLLYTVKSEFYIEALTLAPDNKTFVVTARDSARFLVALWNLKTGQPIRLVLTASDDVEDTIYSPDSSRIFSGGTLFNTQTGKRLGIFSGAVRASSTHHTAFTPDGKTLAIGNDDGSITLWDVETAKLLRTLTSEQIGIKVIAFSPDRATLAVGLSENRTHLWNVKTGKLDHTLSGNGKAVENIIFSPDGKQVLTVEGGGDSGRLWDAQTGRSVMTFPAHGHDGSLYKIVFSVDGSQMLTNSYRYIGNTYESIVWDTLTGEPNNTMGNTGYTYITVDGKAVATYQNPVMLWDKTSGQFLQVDLPDVPSSQLSVLAYAPNSRLLLIIGEQYGIELWDIVKSKRLYRWEWQDVYSRFAVFSPDEKSIFMKTNGEKIKVFDVHNGTLLQTIEPHIGNLSYFEFSPDGKTFAIASDKGTVEIWDAVHYTRLYAVGSARDQVVNLTYSPDNKSILVSYRHAYPQLWDSTTGQPIANLSIAGSQISIFTFAPDGKTLAIGLTDGSVTLWDTATGIALHTFC